MIGMTVGDVLGINSDGEEKRKRWFGSKPVACDTCNNKLADAPWFVDGATSRGWALMCPRCHANYGIGLGTGRGQKYSSEKPYYKLEG